MNSADATVATQRMCFCNEREISAGLVEKLLKLKRPVAERFYALYREQFNPNLR